LNLVLSSIHPTKPAKSVGPFSVVRLDTEALFDSSDNVIARNRDHQWEVGGERYFRLDATAKVRIHFERGVNDPRKMAKSRDFGPFKLFSAVDGIAYTDNRVFAFADAKIGDWFCYDDGRHWALMVVTDAGATAGKNPLRAAALLAPVVAGVIALWEGAKLAYLGRAESVRAQLEAFACEQQDRLDRVTTVTWEAHPNPQVREAELHAEYVAGLIDQARKLGDSARSIRDCAQSARKAAQRFGGMEFFDERTAALSGRRSRLAFPTSLRRL
jgi:hypothetical protein